MAASKNPGLRRYGLVGLGFTHLGVSRGLHGTFGVFYVAFIEAFGWSRAAAAGALSLSVIVEGLSLPLVGSFTDRLGPRRTLLMGGVVLILGLLFTATVSSLWELYLWVGVVTALGLGLIGMVPHIAIIAREFSARRGTALGVAFAGGGFGIMLLVPLSQVLIGRWGWPTAYIGLAALTAVLVIPPVLLFTPPAPAAAKRAEEGQGGGDWTVGQALRSAVFWILFVSRVLASMGNQIVVTHQIAYAVDVGFSKLFAASIFGLMGIWSILGRIFFGYLADRIKREAAFTWVQVVSSLGIVALLLLRDDSFPEMLYAYALFYGLGQGSRALVLSAISADLFLGKSFGAILGYFTLSIGIGGAIGPLLGGFVHDVTGSYTVAFLISILCFIISAISVWAGRAIAQSRVGDKERMA